VRHAPVARRNRAAPYSITIRMFQFLPFNYYAHDSPYSITTPMIQNYYAHEVIPPIQLLCPRTRLLVAPAPKRRVLRVSPRHVRHAPSVWVLVFSV